MGLLRLFLALSVIAGHAQTTVFGFSGMDAWYAVDFFFIISGFYMAMVLDGRYKESSNLQFYKSRIYRLFPAYYVGLAVCFAAYYSDIAHLFSTLGLGGKIWFTLQNLFILGQDASYLICVPSTEVDCVSATKLSINAPAWSLSVELGFYLIAPFVLKSVRKTYLFFLAGALYLLAVSFIEFPVQPQGLLRSADVQMYSYFFYPASFIFFGGGALAYHLSKKDAEPHYLLCVVSILVLSVSQTIMPFWHMLFFAMAIPVLFNYTKNNVFDRKIGELSYPVYIVHYPIVIYLQNHYADSFPASTWISLGSVAAMVSLAIGTVIYWTIDEPVSRLRHSDKFFSHRGAGAGISWRRVLAVPVSSYLAVPFVVVAAIGVKQLSDQRMYSEYAFNLTDANWVAGVSNREAAFFVRKTAANVKSYVVGRTVQFADGETRKIIRTSIYGEYMNIYLEGDLMDGAKYGYPHKLQLLD